MIKSALILILLVLSFQSFAQLRSDAIPYPFYEVQDQNQNQVMNLESGIASFQLRLEMIERAQKNIEVEYFIYNTDLAGKIFTRALVKAAQRGVKVRILVDKSLPIFELNSYYAKELADYGIEVKYYNTAKLIQLSTVQFRNHRKLLSVDDHEALTGGRNIGDDYFDLSEKFNFYDRDIYIKGPIVKTMRESFDEFFNHKISKTPKFPQPPRGYLKKKKRFKYYQKTEAVKKFLEESQEEIFVREKTAEIGKSILNLKNLYTCPVTTFSSDAPGANFGKRLNPDFHKYHRFLRKTLFDKIQEVDRKIIISSPYILNNFHSRRLMKSLLRKNVEIDVYTNSLGSTDAIYVAANLYLTIKKWRRMGIDIFLHDGKWLGEDELIYDGVKDAKWGTHDKVQIYETSNHSEVMIGTYNMDNRSNFYNAEMAIFCKGNDEFTQEVKDSIMKRARSGLQVNLNGTASNKDGEVKNIYSATPGEILKMRLITLPSWLLKFLL